MGIHTPGNPTTVYVSQEGLGDTSWVKAVRNMLVREGLPYIVQGSVKSVVCGPGWTAEDAVTEVGFTVSTGMTRFWNNQRPGVALKH